MRSTTLLGCAASLILTLIGPAFAQEPVARQDVPATTGTIFQPQPSTTGDGRSVVIVPGAQTPTINPTADRKPSGPDPAAPNSHANGDGAH
jgi:hypothetical protein